jgi:hypothetical protein
MTKAIPALLAFALLATMGAPTFAAPGKAGFNLDTHTVTIDKRRKKRIPGGSGCDDPEDIIEHPECRV